MVIVATDNLDVFPWLRKGKARVGRVRRMLTAFLLWCIHYGIDVIPFYIRSHRNLSADMITRANEETLTALALRHDMVRVKLPWWWGNFCEFGNITKWSSALNQKIPSAITDTYG